MKGLRRQLTRWAMKRRVGRYGNNHSGAVNRHYSRYHRAAQQAFVPSLRTPSPTAPGDAEALATDGFLIVPPDEEDARLAADLRARIDAAFERAGNVYPVSEGLARLMDGLDLFPDVLGLIGGHVEQVLEAFFQSHFKIFSVTIYRTVPDESVPESSFLWHFDNAPDQQIKAMIYLDDVTAQTGAFRFKSKAISARARAAGFWHRDDYELARPIFDEAETTHIVEGPAGTVTLFQPGRVAHKATAPRHGHRDVAVLVINPSKIYWREHLARNRHLLSTNAGLCLDLERDTPESIGYRF